MPSDGSIVRKQATAIDHLDDKDSTVDSLFKMVDSDQNGTIDIREFGQIYAVMKDHVRNEHKEHLREEAQIMKAQKRAKLMGVALGVVTLFLGFSIAGNAVSTYGVVELSKEMRMSNGVMVDKNGDDVQLSISQEDYSFQALLQPSTRSIVRDMKEVTIRGGEHNEMNFQILGYNFTGTEDVPKLELFGATTKMCINQDFEMDVPISDPCPHTLASARRLSTFNHKAHDKRQLATCDGGSCGSCDYGTRCMTTCLSPRTQHCAWDTIGNVRGKTSRTSHNADSR
jgi:hypothetical protein